MPKTTTRLFSLLLVLIIAVSLIPINASAEITYEDYHCTFTTFEDLKELVAKSGGKFTDAIYTGKEPLVIESNLTLPEYFTLESSPQREIQIPAGVTLSASSYVGFDSTIVDGTLAASVSTDNLIVNGTVTGDEIYIYNSLSGTGNIKCNDVFTANFTNLNAFNLDRIDLSNANRGSLRFPVTSMDELEKLHAIASQDSRSIIEYGCTIQEPISIAKSFVFPGNTVISNNQPLTIEKNCTLEVNGATAIGAPVTIEGSFVNNFLTAVAGMEGAYGSLSFTGNGTYSGSGTLVVYADSRDAISSVITGIDLSHFKITEETEDDWELGLFGQRWHLEYMGPGYIQPEPEPTEPVDPNLPTITGTYTTDLTMSAADLGVNAPDALLRATLTFTDDGKASATWEALDVTALQKFFHGMFVNSYYAMAYGAGITDINEIEAYCIESTGMSVSAYMDQFVPYDAIRLAFTPSNTNGTYTYNDDHTAIFTDMPIMDVPSDPAVENSFVIGDNTLYLNAASYGKPDYTFVCTRK